MTTVLRGNWNYPTTIWAGPGRIGELARMPARRAGIERPLLVTDEGLTGAPMIKNALAALKNAALFGAVRGNPALEPCRGGTAAPTVPAAMTASSRFGGGSALDAGKVVAFMSGQTRPLWDFEDIGDWWTRADPAGIAPVVAVPTTAGTGLGSRPGRRNPQRGDASEENHLSSADDAAHRHFRCGTHRRAAAGSDRRHRHGCLRSLFRGILCAGIPPAGGRRRARGHAAHPAASCRAPARTARTSRRARRCWPPHRWAQRPFRRVSAACTRSRTRSVRGSTPTTA